MAALAQTPRDPSLVQIVRGDFHFDAVARHNAHEALPHLSSDRRQHHMLVVQLHAEHRARQHRLNHTFDFNTFFFQIAPFDGSLRFDRSHRNDEDRTSQKKARARASFSD